MRLRFFNRLLCNTAFFGFWSVEILCSGSGLSPDSEPPTLRVSYRLLRLFESFREC